MNQRESPDAKWWEQAWHFVSSNPLISTVMGGLIVVVVGVPLTALIVDDAGDGSSEPTAGPSKTPLAVGQTRRSGPLAFTLLRRIECNKSRRDLPPVIRQAEAESGVLFPIKGELCFGRFRARNASNSALVVTLGSTFLSVRSRRFPDVAGVPLVPPRLFPDEQARFTLIFDIPKDVAPTSVTLGAPFSKPLTWQAQ